MTDYENSLIQIFNGRTLEELRIMLKEQSQQSAIAASKYRETGLSTFKEDKEHHANSCNVLKFVIANREFHDEHRALLEIH